MLPLPSKCMKAVCSFHSAHLNRLEKKLVTLRKHIVQFPKLSECEVKPVFRKRPHMTRLSLQSERGLRCIVAFPTTTR